ncbi:DUF1588 domain-containing protein [Neorhodopirellula pilleata]|uniref:PA14 domain protein n=1 Tax=Neorhodopirellula pilleata TaxID=2714738 RepID=A0A5C6AV27_9BACT|nr:DUF1588 domain-containing protein [Neorhodopirellula pilleata]TWU01974.1 PA14 domain protein [Neorhodopirellula pilleata]
MNLRSPITDAPERLLGNARRSRGGDFQSPVLETSTESRRHVWMWQLLVVVCLIGSGFFGGSASGAEQPTAETLVAKGGEIFKSQCAACHGETGQGTEDSYPDPLTGDSSIGELTEIIADTMPEEDPEKCVGEDAAAVAAYIHHAFYSEAAQLRNRPPRQALQRLTGTQLHNSLMNLYSHFHGVKEDRWKDRVTEHGVKVSYYDGKGWKKEDRKFEGNVDQIDFDYKLDGPKHPDGSDLGIDGEQFHAHFEGGLRVEQTGRYEIIVRSTTSFEFTFGSWRNKLIDNHVQSEGRNEFRRTIWLTGGRSYPFKLDLNQRKRKGETPPSSVSLSWVRPGGVEEIIPASQLMPGWVPSAARVQTKMPPDDRSYGFERGISVDAGWDEAVTAAALEFADLAINELWPDHLDRNKKDDRPRPEKLRDLLTTLISVAHRGDAETVGAKSLLDAIMAETQDEIEIIKYAVLLTVKSPRFLYPTLDEDRNRSWQVGTLLSLTLHDAVPSDGWFVNDLNANKLNDPKVIRQVATRYVDDARTRAKLREMFYHWLEMSPEDDLRKDDEKFPGFDATILSDLRKSLDGFLDEIVWSETSDFRQLLYSDWTLTTPRLTDFYGDAWKPSSDQASEHGDDPIARSGLKRTVRNHQTHIGVLSHPLVMAKFAHHQETSPIHRGVFLIRHVMGRTLRPPNAAFAPLSPDLHPDLTTRQRVALQTSPESCQICHAKINPLGFTLENFDAIGRFRQTDGKHPIDAGGHYDTRDDQKIEFENARELANYAAGSRDAQSAFVSRVFQYFTKQPIAAFGLDRLEQLTDQFRDSGCNIRQLLIEVAVIAAEGPLTDTNQT